MNLKKLVYSGMAAALVLSCAVSAVEASSTYRTRFRTAYPAANGQRIDTCSLCHITTQPVVLNSYGSDYSTHSNNFAAIEALDSDGDTFNNLDEITALTFPGLETDHPTAVIPAWRTGETDLGNGWRSLPWFGTYNVTRDPWIYHQQHGYVFAFEAGSGMFIWDTRMQAFWWTSPDTYPTMYRFGATPGWLWYQKGSSSPRVFFSYATGQWESIP